MGEKTSPVNKVVGNARGPPDALEDQRSLSKSVEYDATLTQRWVPRRHAFCTSNLPLD
jgi:hypothetical protein